MSKPTDIFLDVLCMNCMKLIPYLEIETHSSNCTQVNSEVRLLDQSPAIQSVNYKLKQLNEALKRLIKNKGLLAQANNNEYYLRMLGEYTNDLLIATDYTREAIINCNETIKNIFKLTKNYNGSLSLKIYIERLLILGKQKNTQLFNCYKELNKLPENVKTLEQLTQEKDEKISQLRKSKEMIRTSVEFKRNTMGRTRNV